MSDSSHDRLRPIASPQNSLLKQLRRAFHSGQLTEDGYCAIESVRIVEEAIRSGLKFKAIVFSTAAQQHASRLLPQIGVHVQTLVAPDSVFTGAVATENPQGVAALVKLKEASLDALIETSCPLILIIAGVQDPGNLGTILRSAEAFGVTGALLIHGTVSPFNAKVVRASAGSLFRLHVVRAEIGAGLMKLREHEFRLVATSSHKGTAVHEADLTGPLAIFVGNEGAGLPKELLGEIDETVVIPHSPRVESLNVAVATSITLYEISRQRVENPAQRHRATK
ncbi:MAG: RNA methyltransferase [Terriglobales bacterium]|jgi:TrmH family RNA methyltransferase